MAVAQEAPVLLLDEPTSNLDLGHQTGIMDLAKDLQQKRRGALLVAMHDLTLAAQYCDRVVMLEPVSRLAEAEPQAIFSGTVAEALASADPRVAAFMQGGTASLEREAG